ncbi:MULTISPECIES: hypothetical protein [Brucella]|uniref:hypothetical protein n=1 Tax=Brucella TaxID=234 RepID=UPI0013AEBB3C|nr:MULTISPECIES: hypothetical protein [Brucella]MBA8842269.1 hypothetical protein [Ochrobactrum sp. RH1CCR137]MCH6203287.1 hypothetical protein [Brucella ciceri]
MKKTPLRRGFYFLDPHPDEEARRAVSKDRPSRLRFAPHLRVRGVALDKEARRARVKKVRGVIEILVMTRRKWCFSRTGAECTLERIPKSVKRFSGKMRVKTKN